MKLTAKDRQLLELFCSRTDAIASSPICRKGKISVGIKMTGERGGSLEHQAQGPSSTELLPVVTIIRQFYSPSESINFKNIYKLVYQLLVSSGTASESTLDHVRRAMSSFKQITKRLPVGLKLGGKTMTPRDVIDIWFNGNIFHADPAKSALYMSLWRSPAGPWADFCFRSAIVHLSALMVYFGALVRTEVLNKEQLA